MISKERLEELIEKEAVVFIINCNNDVRRIPLGESVTYFADGGNVFCYPFGNCSIDKVFETEEEAKWYREFGCIERTERLELPTWEEFSNGKFCHFISKECKYSLSPNLIHDTIFLYECVWGGGFYVHSRWELTKENYTIACRKAKELFLGEKDVKD